MNKKVRISSSSLFGCQKRGCQTEKLGFRNPIDSCLILKKTLMAIVFKRFKVAIIDQSYSLSSPEPISGKLYLMSFEEEMTILGKRKTNYCISLFKDNSGNIYSGNLSKIDNRYHITYLIKSTSFNDGNNHHLNISGEEIVDENSYKINKSANGVLPTDNTTKEKRSKFLSDHQIKEINYYSLKYINVLFDKQFTDLDEFYRDSFIFDMEDKRVDFMVKLFFMLSASKHHTGKSVAKVMTDTMGINNTSNPQYNKIISLIENKKKNLLKNGCKESIHYYFDEYIESIRNSTKYFENKRRWKAGGDDNGDLPLLSRGVYLYNSKNKTIRDIVKKKLSDLYEKIDSSPENDKMTAICNYVMEKANHEILYGNSREQELGFTRDEWSPAASKERKYIYKYMFDQYNKELTNRCVSEYEAGCFLDAFGNCDHFTNNVILNLSHMKIDKKYDFGMFIVKSEKEKYLNKCHVCCYLKDAITKKIMIIDPWMNVYYDLKDCEIFLSHYFKKSFKVLMEPKRYGRRLFIQNVVNSKIKSKTEYNYYVFLKHLKFHYQSINR